MIFFYSATGNTYALTQRLSRKLQQKSVSITGTSEFDLAESDDSIGFMFPIYSWGIPQVVSDFIKKLPAGFLKGKYVWGICTAGDEAGIAMRLFSSMIERLRGNKADALFSVIMPNTYVLLPGFDVDSEDVAKEKVRKARTRIDQISDLLARRESGIYDVTEGSLPALRTRLLFPLFKRWGIDTGRWHTTSECNGCGRCAKVCPAGNITIDAGTRQPQWGKNCLSCCACFHNCRQGAIQYGSITRKHHRYPGISALMPELDL